MTKDQKVTGYARAFFEIARSEGDIDRVADELFRVARTLETQQELRQSLTDIYLPIEAKEKLLDEALGAQVSPHVLNIIKFAVSQGQARSLVKISDELASLAEEESRREIAEVRSAIPLDEEQKRRLGEALGSAMNKDVSVKVVVDPSVIGGIFARVGDVVMDGTMKHKLDLLKDHLKDRLSVR